MPALAAILVEYPFYLVPAFPQLRERLAGASLPGFLTASAVLPYLACCCGAIQFQWIGLVKLIALALALSLWYVVLPAVAIIDVAFLGFIAAVLLGRYCDAIYPAPVKGADVAILGKVAVYQIAVMALILQRRVRETGYGFLPTWKDWRIGGRHYLYFLPVGIAIALSLKALHWGPVKPLWTIAGTFLGFLFVVALGEEFFFRGLLQTRCAAWFKSEVSGVALMALLFGLAHAPGFILRHAGLEEAIGSDPSPADAIAYAIVILSVGGIFFGIVWARTKNLWAVMLIHAATDLLPNLKRFVVTWDI